MFYSPLCSSPAHSNFNARVSFTGREIERGGGKKKNNKILSSVFHLAFRKGLKIAAAWPEAHCLSQDSAQKIYGLLTALIAQYSVLNQRKEKVKCFPRASAAWGGSAHPHRLQATSIHVPCQKKGENPPNLLFYIYNYFFFNARGAASFAPFPSGPRVGPRLAKPISSLPRFPKKNPTKIQVTSLAKQHEHPQTHRSGELGPKLPRLEPSQPEKEVLFVPESKPTAPPARCRRASLRMRQGRLRLLSVFRVQGRHTDGLFEPARTDDISSLRTQV